MKFRVLVYASITAMALSACSGSDVAIDFPESGSPQVASGENETEGVRNTPSTTSPQPAPPAVPEAAEFEDGEILYDESLEDALVYGDDIEDLYDPETSVNIWDDVPVVGSRELCDLVEPIEELSTGSFDVGTPDDVETLFRAYEDVYGALAEVAPPSFSEAAAIAADGYTNIARELESRDWDLSSFALEMPEWYYVHYDAIQSVMPDIEVGLEAECS